MKKEKIVLSLGGSLIVPDKINVDYLKKFKEVINKNKNKYKFIIVCGGGSIARKYISGLKELGMNLKFQSYSGISVTRMNARFINYLFGKDPKEGVPHSLKKLKQEIKNNNVVICGALEYKPNQTSDSTAATIASEFNSKFINLTNVKGLYNKNPLKYKNAKFIKKESWDDFYKRVKKIEFKPGQHFVLDQTAAKIIKRKKIPTYILGKDLKQFDNLLNNKILKEL